MLKLSFVLRLIDSTWEMLRDDNASLPLDSWKPLTLLPLLTGHDFLGDLYMGALLEVEAAWALASQRLTAFDSRLVPSAYVCMLKSYTFPLQNLDFGRNTYVKVDDCKSGYLSWETSTIFFFGVGWGFRFQASGR